MEGANGMSKLRRRIAAVLVLTSALAVLPVLLAQSSTKRSAAATAATARMAHAALRERARGEEEGGGADAEAYTDRAYPLERHIAVSHPATPCAPT